MTYNKLGIILTGVQLALRTVGSALVPIPKVTLDALVQLAIQSELVHTLPRPVETSMNALGLMLSLPTVELEALVSILQEDLNVNVQLDTKLLLPIPLLLAPILTNVQLTWQTVVLALAPIQRVTLNALVRPATNHLKIISAELVS